MSDEISRKMTLAAELIERFVSGRTAAWEWDDFISASHREASIEEARRSCLRIAQYAGWTSAEGASQLTALARTLRSEVEQRARGLSR